MFVIPVAFSKEHKKMLAHCPLIILVFLNPLLVSAKSNNVDTSSHHSAFSLEDTSSPITSPTNVSPMDSDFTTQAALSSLTARPTNNIINTNSFYDVVFLTSTAGAIKTIQITFPVGTTIPSTAFFNEAEKCVPGSNCAILTGTASKSGQTITFTVTSAVNVPAGTKIRLEFSNINNPVFPSANYKVTVTTRNAANTPIDGPTQSTAYTVKQIGANVIADNSITSTKPAESFMKRVTLTDDAAGNSRGWNPNGAATHFQIIDPAMGSTDNVFITIEIRTSSNVNFFCDVVNHVGFLQTFDITCSLAPVEGTELHYIVENLPGHFF